LLAVEQDETASAHLFPTAGGTGAAACAAAALACDGINSAIRKQFFPMKAAALFRRQHWRGVTR